MGRADGGWFEYCGVSSLSLGVRLMDSNVVQFPDMRGSALVAAGRSGDVWQSENAREGYEIKRKIRIPLSRYDELTALLSQSGQLRFSFMPGYAYRARVNQSGSSRNKAISFTQVTLDSDPILEGTIVFTCQPFRYVYPEAGEITVASTMQTINNPGTAPSQPRVTIRGSGSFSVSIGMQTMFFQNVSDGIIVDSELGDALSLDGAQLRNDRIGSSEFFEIQPGTNVVQWLTGGSDESGGSVPGSVSGVSILPRWRSV